MRMYVDDGVAKLLVVVGEVGAEPFFICANENIGRHEETLDVYSCRDGVGGVVDYEIS